MDQQSTSQASSSSQAQVQAQAQAGPAQPAKRGCIMFLPMDGTGHVLTMIGLAYRFLKRHFDIVFVVAKPFAKYLAGTPFRIEYLEDTPYDQLTDPQERWANTMARNAVHFHKPPIEQAFLQGIFLDDFVNTVININDQLEKAIRKYKPDYILVDYYVTIPAVVTSRIPWSCIVSSNPLMIYQINDGPPYYSGYSMYEDSSNWLEFKTRFNIAISGPMIKMQRFAAERGVNLPPAKVWTQSPYQNFYIYPQPLDYVEVRGYPLSKWTRLDHCLRPFASDQDPLGCDLESLKPQLPKIYFSLGSMGSADIVLMNILLNIFKDTPYQYIVSKGPNSDKIRLPANATGSQYLNQLKILPLVDLVIFHGGNNTLIECLYFGKKMLILPLFGDQFDNAARIVDKKLGLALRPYQVKPEEMKVAIDSLLNDDQLHNSLTAISNYLKKADTTNTIVDAVERFIKGIQKL